MKFTIETIDPHNLKNGIRQEDSEMPKAFLIEPHSGGVLVATGVSRWRTGLQMISAVGATV